MRICIELATGKLIEAQTGGEGLHLPEGEEREAYRVASLEALRTNAILAGYLPDAISVSFVSDVEGAALLSTTSLTPRLVTDESERTSCRQDSSLMTLINQTRAEWITWAGASFPSLTAAEKSRLGVLFWVVAIGVRHQVR
jgi:hypothetical protein